MHFDVWLFLCAVKSCAYVSKLHPDWWSSFIDQSRSWESNSCLHDPGRPRPFVDTHFNNCVHSSLLVDPILSQMNPVLNPHTLVLKIHFKWPFILPSLPRCLKWFLPCKLWMLFLWPYRFMVRLTMLWATVYSRVVGWVVNDKSESNPAVLT
jgi:hypothetical protein